MLIALIAIGGLITLGGMTVLSVQGGLAAISHDRHRSAALYAAESGASVAMIYLRGHVQANPVFWSDYVNPNNVTPQSPADLPGNGIEPGQPGNVFSEDMVAWYQVEILNNLDDPGYAAGDDSDGTVIIRSTGHGPNDTTAQVEWRVQASGTPGSGRPCPSYGQRGVAEDGAGRNDCIGNIVSTDTATYRPGS
ncbi:MAG TPA: hypothetical protein VHE35_26315 [Kofleriaceae bacterium]|nr:hypothetical protein [Kofleriaceae bacterium]